MGSVSQMPGQRTAEAAWQRYVALVRATQDDFALRSDRGHCEAVLRAYRVFADAFVALPSER